MRPKDALLSQENKGRFPAFCHGSSLASCGKHSRQLLRPPVLGRRKSNYGEPVPDLAAVTDHENNFVFDLLAAVADHKDIQSLTHFEDSVEDSRTADLAWLTQQDQD